MVLHLFFVVIGVWARVSEMVAVAREWRGLVLPGIIMGLLGYAVGTYLGFGVAYLVRGLAIGL